MGSIPDLKAGMFHVIPGTTKTSLLMARVSFFQRAEQNVRIEAFLKPWRERADCSTL